MKKIASIIVDKRNLIFLIVIIGMIFSIFSRGWVNVEDDLSEYLPDTSSTRQGLDLMDEQFTTFGTAQIMIANITFNDAQKICDEIEAIKGVESVDFDETTDHYNKVSALFTVTFSYSENDDRCLDLLSQIKQKYAGYDLYVSTSLGNTKKQIIDQEINVIMAIVAVIVVTVIALTSETWGEVPVLLLTFVLAMILNQGTNFLLGTISFVSNSVTSILQLALSLDYAIILVNRYKEERKDKELREAVIEALSKGIPEIGASSLTTIGGLIAMLFMQFKVGPDMAICLIKSIFFALGSVFFIMPGLLMLFGPLMDRTHHKVFIPKVSFIGKYAYATRKLVPLPALAVIIVCSVLSGNCPYAYGYDAITTPKLNDVQIAENMIKDTFTSPSMVALVVPTGDYETEKKMIKEIESEDMVDHVTGLANTEALDGYMLTDSLTPRQFAELADLDYEAAQVVYMAYAVDNEEYGRIIGGISKYSVPLVDMFIYAADKIEEGYVELDEDKEQDILDAADEMRNAKLQLVGSEYNRMLVYFDLPDGGDLTYSYIDNLEDIAREYYDDGDIYVVGDVTSEYDFKKSFATDNVIVSVISVLVVLLVLLFTFNSVGLPLLLIAIIQGSIWINFTIPTFTHVNLFFLSYLIVSSIQMGANIDYAIVIASRFMELKDKMEPREAIIETMNYAFPTIITSGPILAISGYLIGNMTSECAIVGVGQSLFRGTLISMVMVMFVLPQILLISVKIIDKTSFKTVKLLGCAAMIGMLCTMMPMNTLAEEKTANAVTADAVTADESKPENQAAVAVSAVTAAADAASASEAKPDRKASEQAAADLRIYNIADLRRFAKLCEYDVNTKDKLIVLEADIDLSSAQWQPLPSFAGTFDGNGHKITGLNIASAAAPAGLFAQINEGATVRNLKVEGEVKLEGTKSYGAGIAGINYGTIENCSFAGSIDAKTYAGGIAAYNAQTGTIGSCSYKGHITGSSMTGGIAGYNEGVIKGCENRSFVNTVSVDPTFSLDDLSLDLQTSIKRLSSPDTYNLIVDTGGIAGYSKGVVIGCYNYAGVGYEHVGYNVGGIIGRNCGYVSECVNRGMVQGRRDVGGIVGMAEPSVIIKEDEDYTEKLREQAKAMNSLLDRTINDAGDASDRLTDQINELQNRIDWATDSFKDLTDGLEEFTDSNIEEMNRATDTLHDGINTASDVTDELNSAGRNLSKASQALMNGDIQGALEYLANARADAKMAGTDAKEFFDYAAREDKLSFTPLGDERHQQMQSVYDSLDDVSDQMSAITGEVSSTSDILQSDAQSVNKSSKDISDTVGDAIDEINSFSIGGRITDMTQDTAYVAGTDGAKLSQADGRIVGCTNYADISGDIDAGGIAGSMGLYNKLDPENDLDTSESLTSVLRRQYELRVIITGCINDAQSRVECRRSFAGGIVGLQEIGLITDCQGYGRIGNEDSGYVGGIAGCAKSGIKRCYAKCFLYGEKFLGGIAGSTTADVKKSDSKDCDAVIENCRAMVQAPSDSQYAGSICGYDAGTFTGNYFVSDELAGINRASYTGKAEPITYDSLIAQTGTPEQFRTFTLTFIADEDEDDDEEGVVVAQKTFTYGESFDESVYPQIPEKENYYGTWENIPLDHLTFDTDINAEYTMYITAMAATQTRVDGRRTFFLEGEYGTDARFEAQPVVESFEVSAPEGLSEFAHAFDRSIIEQWSLRFPDNREHTVRYLVPESESSEANRIAVYAMVNGAWEPLETEMVGSYMQFKVSGQMAKITVLETSIVWWIPALGAMLVAVIIVIISIRHHLRKWVTVLLVIICAEIAGVIALWHYNPSISDTMRNYRIVDSYLENMNLTVRIDCNINRNGNVTQLQGDGYFVDVAGKQVICIAGEDEKYYVTDSQVITSDGTVYELQGHLPTSREMVRMLYELSRNGKIERLDMEDGRLSRIREEGCSLDIKIYSDTIEYMDLEWDGTYKGEDVMGANITIHIVPDASIEVDRTVPRKVRNIINAQK